MSADGLMLLVEAPGMPQLVVPVAEAQYAAEPMVQVQSSGAGWWLGAQACRQHTRGSAWFSEFLNREAEPGMLASGGARASKFALCRSVAPRGIEMSSYPPIVPLLEHAATDPRLAGNAVRFSDFAPFMLVNLASAEEIAHEAGVAHYPIEPFRSNLVVRAASGWEEEEWACVDVLPASASRGRAASRTPLLTLRRIAPCPACTAPCKEDLHKAHFPNRPTPPADPAAEWGSWWTGATFGVYFGHGGTEGSTLSVGDRLVVQTTTSPDVPTMRARAALMVHAKASVAFALVWQLVAMVLAAAMGVVAAARGRPHRALADERRE